MSTLFALLPVEIRLQLVRVASDLWPVLDEVEDLPPTLAIDYRAKRRFTLQAARYGGVEYCRRYIDRSDCGPVFVEEIVRWDRADLLEFTDLLVPVLYDYALDNSRWMRVARHDAVLIFTKMCESPCEDKRVAAILLRHNALKCLTHFLDHVSTLEVLSSERDFHGIQLGTVQFLLDRGYSFPRTVLDDLLAHREHDAVVVLLLRYGYRFQDDPWAYVAHRRDDEMLPVLLEYKIRPTVKRLRAWLRGGEVELLRDLYGRGVWKYKHSLLRFNNSYLHSGSVRLLLEVAGKQRDQAVERLRKLMHPDDLQKVIDAPTEL